MKPIVSVLFILISYNYALAQAKLYSKTASISFYSKAPLEDITATNNAGLCVWNTADDSIEFSVLMKGFEFKKALMQVHFNENYVESSKYPKATFKGTVENSKDISLTADAEKKVNVSGTLTIHGITHPVNVTATIKIKNGIVSSVSNFNILLADYNIKIPSIVRGHINNEVSIAVTVRAFKVFTTN